VHQESTLISVNSLVKDFGSLRAVDNLSFEVPAGKIFALLGPNGAGKSTTIKMLTTTLAPSSGSILLNGHDPVKEPLAARRSFGIVFQDPSLDNELTAYENLELHAVLYGVPGNLRIQRIKEFLNFVELWERRDSVVKTFSGGMKRRLEIARGLLHTPKVLFLDEPTLGLDPQTRNHIWSYVQRVVQEQGMTVLFTTHYMDEADRVADEIAVVDHGKIVARGTAASLKERTQKHTLEDAFIALTGHAIRDEEAGTQQQMRDFSKAWSKQR
jgi:ABC-2 type transport system ATP-binding protein